MQRVLLSFKSSVLFQLSTDFCFIIRRVAVRQDTCSIVAISLNMTERLHPVIWSLNGLPFDCKYARSVPRPIGKSDPFYKMYSVT